MHRMRDLLLRVSGTRGGDRRAKTPLMNHGFHRPEEDVLIGNQDAIKI
jgi:hypothetical protein